MGCCCSKADGSVVLQKTAVTGTDAGIIAGGVLAGGAIAGPFAPVGMVIGGIVAAAAVGTVGRRVKDKLGVDGLISPDELVKNGGNIWRQLVTSEEVLEKLPIIGLLRVDRGTAPVPPVMLDNTMSGSTNSKLFRVHPVTVRGLDYDSVRAGTLVAEQDAALDLALQELSAAGAIAITGDSGMFIHFQKKCAQKTKLPVMLSPLLQAPLLEAVLSPQASVLVVTSDSSTFGQAELERLLLDEQLVGDAPTAERFILRGLEGLAGFADPHQPINLEATQAALFELIAQAQAELAGLGTPLGAILFESSLLPAFADAVRAQFSLPVADNFTLADFALKACTDNPRFGVAFGPAAAADVSAKLNPADMPAIGILRIDYTYPAALGDAAHPNSYYYRTPHATWTGLSFERAQAGGPLDEPLRAAMTSAVRALEAEGVVGIAGDCGFLMNYQDDARSACEVPCFISALLQCSVLSALFDLQEQILVLTANGPALAPHMPRLLAHCHVTDPAQQARFLVAGCQDLPGFDAVAKGEAVDVPRVLPHVVELVQAERAKHPRIRAVLLECTELPPYADAVRAATGLPVLDAITMVDFFHAAVSENPYFGIDWAALASTPAFSN